MLSGLCAFCGNQTHFTARSGRALNTVSHGVDAVLQLDVAATCDACHRFNVARGQNQARRSSGIAAGMILDSGTAIREGEQMTVSEWSPPAMIPVDVSFIPVGVAGFYKEAHDAFSVSAHRAVLLLVRSVVEATAKERGITKGTLVGKIDQLLEKGEIRRGTQEMAHALRILGNDMAHGDIDDVPTAEDAKDALTIAKFVLDDVYVADALRADMLDRRKPTTSAK